MIMGSAGPVKRGVNRCVRDLGVIVGMVDQGPRRDREPERSEGGQWCWRAVGMRAGIRACGARLAIMRAAGGALAGSGWRVGCGRGGGEALLQGLDE